MKIHKDQLNRHLQIRNIPRRIISLVPSQTELLCDFGLEANIVGITKFCVHPAHLKKTKTIVGGTKNVKYDVIISLQPDIILCNKEENTLEMIRELEKVAAVHISDIYTFKDCLTLLSLYGELFEKQKEAASIIHILQQKQQDFTAFFKNKSKVKVAYFIWRNPWMVAAKHTFINHMLQLNNFENCYGHLLRYPEIDPSMSSLPSPDIILLSSEPYPFKEKHKEELQLFFPKAKILLVDGEMFSWYGTRLLEAFDYFKLLHQDYE